MIDATDFDIINNMKIIRNNKTSKDCGVVAAYNAASWCNKNRPYKDIEKIARSCGYSPKNGIYAFQFSNLMKKLNIPAKKIKMKNIKEIESNLYTGLFFVFLYTPINSFSGHAISAFMGQDGHIKLVNPDEKRVTWNDFAADVYSNGMRNISIYEIPNRSMIKHYDDNRAA